jgi:hypothetical protein
MNGNIDDNTDTINIGKKDSIKKDFIEYTKTRRTNNKRIIKVETLKQMATIINA